ncbi:hypothetical protein ACX93W_01680 [Paenibacillus sp. CAU 1782]
MKKEIVSSVIKDLVSKDPSPQAILEKQVRFSISLTNLQSKRLDILTDRIEISKQEFISKVLDAAMRELEYELKLIEQSSRDLLGVTKYQLRTEYVNEIVERLGIKQEDWWDLIERHNP